MTTHTYAEQDARDMDRLCTWRVLCGEFGENFISSRISDAERESLRRAIALEESGLKLVVADDPAGDYDSPRVLEGHSRLFGGANYVALRKPPATSHNGFLSEEGDNNYGNL